MKKVFTIILVIASVFSMASAYNPPVGSESLFELSSPDALAGKQSVTGGAIFSVGADSLVVNPALAGGEQRVNLNLGYTFLHSGDKNNKNPVGSAFQTGLLIPTKMFVLSTYLNGTFISYNEMYLGNSMNLKLGLSKEITDKLDVGLSLNTGISWNSGIVDWSLSGNVGFNYNCGDLGFLKDFRYGISVLNLGKNYSKGAVGFNPEKPLSPFPTLGTIKIGVATSFIKTDTVNLGMALDIGTSLFQNLLVDANMQFAIKNMFVVSFGEKINMVECVNKKYSWIPSIGLSFKFAFDVKNSQYLDKKGWNESEMTVSAAYKNIYKTINAASIGVDLDLGMEDTSAPVIEFLDEE